MNDNRIMNSNKESDSNKIYYTLSHKNQYQYAIEGIIASDLITPDNVKIWKKYLKGVLQQAVTPEAMETELFQLLKKEKEEQDRQAVLWENRRLESQKANERRSEICKPRINYIPKGLTVDYEQEYAATLDNAFDFTATTSDDFLYQLRYIERWTKKSIPQLLAMKRPDAAYAIAVELCRHLLVFWNRKDIHEYLIHYKSRIKKQILASIQALAETVTAWNNEEKRQWTCKFIADQATLYTGFRGLEQTIMGFRPMMTFSGEPVKVIREMNDEERDLQQLKERKVQMAEKVRLAAGREANSVIPLNADYENCIFTRRNVDWECSYIANLMDEEGEVIMKLVENQEYDLAALRFMQLNKSMCRHFVSDEHYCFFDDQYSPDYMIDWLIGKFNEWIQSGLFPSSTIDFMQKAWKEILGEESYTEYGVPSGWMDFEEFLDV